MRGAGTFMLVFMLALLLFVPLGIAGGLGAPGLLLGALVGVPLFAGLLVVGLPVLLVGLAIAAVGAVLFALLGVAVGAAALVLKVAVFVVLPIAAVVWMVKRALVRG